MKRLACEKFAIALGMGGDEFNSYQSVIGVGAWLGAIMLFNV